MKKSVIIILSGLFVFLILIYWTSPIAFTKEGLLTKKEVDHFDTSYELGVTRRHSEDVKKIYLFSIGTKKTNVNRESKGKVEKIELKKHFSWLILLGLGSFRRLCISSHYKFKEVLVYDLCYLVSIFLIKMLVESFRKRSINF